MAPKRLFRGGGAGGTADGTPGWRQPRGSLAWGSSVGSAGAAGGGLLRGLGDCLGAAAPRGASPGAPGAVPEECAAAGRAGRAASTAVPRPPVKDPSVPPALARVVHPPFSASASRSLRSAASFVVNLARRAGKEDLFQERLEGLYTPSAIGLRGGGEGLWACWPLKGMKVLESVAQGTQSPWNERSYIWGDMAVVRTLHGTRPHFLPSLLESGRLVRNPHGDPAVTGPRAALGRGRSEWRQDGSFFDGYGGVWSSMDPDTAEMYAWPEQLVPDSSASSSSGKGQREDPVAFSIPAGAKWGYQAMLLCAANWWKMHNSPKKYCTYQTPTSPVRIAPTHLLVRRWEKGRHKSLDQYCPARGMMWGPDATVVCAADVEEEEEEDEEKEDWMLEEEREWQEMEQEEEEEEEPPAPPAPPEGPLWNLRERSGPIVGGKPTGWVAYHCPGTQDVWCHYRSPRGDEWMWEPGWPAAQRCQENEEDEEDED